MVVLSVAGDPDTGAVRNVLLKPLHKGEQHGQRGFFGWFNRTFNRNAERW